MLRFVRLSASDFGQMGLDYTSKPRSYIKSNVYFVRKYV